MGGLRDAIPGHGMIGDVARGRDRYVDLLRALAILAVVTGHWLVAAVTVQDGRLGGINALQVLPWARPLTWLLQVMPVFFLVGGYANAASWSSHRRRGGHGVSWVRSRMYRLLRPTAVFVAVLAATAGLGRAVGLDPETVRDAAWVAAISLWFLAVYLAVMALAPIVITAQRRWGPGVTITLLGAWVAAADLSRLVFEAPFFAWSTYLLGWLTVHQLGVAWRDGALTRSPAAAWLLAGGGLVCLLLGTGPGPYAVSMVGAVGPGLANTAPPTLALLALAATQTGLILLLRGPADRWLTRPRAWMAVVAVNSVVLTVYLWHMVPILVVAPALVLTGVWPQYPLGSAAWLLLRPPWLFALGIVLLGLVMVFGRWEQPRLRGAPDGRPAESGWAAVRLGVGVAACLAALTTLAATGFAGLGPTPVPIVELTVLAAGLLLVGGGIPIIGRLRAHRG
ncbi:MAG: acyltransferase [Pseudonocardiaceae bacterium]